MKLFKLFLLIIFISLYSCKENTKHKVFDKSSEKTKVNSNIDKWHKAAAEADFEAYFGLMTNNAIFIGTDATENWTNEEFKVFSKPYFDKGKAWNFKSIQRNVYFSSDYNTAWFDELLETQMGICRGSGVVYKEDEQWKIKHYVLSMTIPNDQVTEIVKQKKEIDSLLIENLTTK